MSLDQNTKALVTGASSGIGEATARALRNRGVKVYAAARRLDRLEQLAADIADAVVYCVDAPWRVNVSQMEIVPTEQTYGGAQFVPFKGRGSQ